MQSEVFERSHEIDAVQESITRRMFPFALTHSTPYSGPCAAIYEANIGVAEMTRIHSQVSFSGHRRRPLTAESAGYSVALVEEGAHIDFEGRRKGRMHPGNIYLIGSHHYPFATELKAAGTSLAISLPFSLMKARFPCIDDWCLRAIDTNSGSAAVLRHTMTSIWTERQRIDNTYGAGLIEALLHLVDVVFKEGDSIPAAITRSTEFHMLRLRTLVDANLTRSDLTPDFMAGELGISRSYLFKLLAKFNTTFNSLVINRRLERSRVLLSDPLSIDRTISEIAAAVGFLDAAHFSHRFSKRFGKSPRAYRVGLLRDHTPCTAGRTDP